MSVNRFWSSPPRSTASHTLPVGRSPGLPAVKAGKQRYREDPLQEPTYVFPRPSPIAPTQDRYHTGRDVERRRTCGLRLARLDALIRARWTPIPTCSPPCRPCGWPSGTSTFSGQVLPAHRGQFRSGPAGSSSGKTIAPIPSPIPAPNPFDLGRRPLLDHLRLDLSGAGRRAVDSATGTRRLRRLRSRPLPSA